MAETFYATGKRKNAIARVRLTPGDGKMIINEKGLSDYFGRETLQMIVRQPLELTENISKWNISVNVLGGGLSGQAGAIRHGISRALLLIDASLRSKLKKEGLITRDSREKERKKYGQKGARKRFQFSKR
jgi:small subunit ribosomal protein S9